MRRTTGPVIEVETLADFDRRVALGTRSLAGWHLQSIDLSERSAVLRSLPVAGALFLGCRFAADDEDSVRHRGGIVFPSVPDAPLRSAERRVGKDCVRTCRSRGAPEL